jgi:hypothetical protein
VSMSSKKAYPALSASLLGIDQGELYKRWKHKDAEAE